MKPYQKIVIGVVAGIAFALVYEFFINGPVAGMISLALQTLVLIYCVIRGQKAPLPLRAFISILVLHWAFGACLVGRTMGPGLTGQTFGTALMVFLLYGALPCLTLLRFWPKKLGAAFVIALFPLAFLLATTEAGIEEYLFVQKYHETGIGPTKRWTVSNHWLAYDPINHRLDGSD